MFGLIGEAISLRSFSSLWYWIAVAVFWIAATTRVLGVSFATVDRATAGGAALVHLEMIMHAAANQWATSWAYWQVWWVAIGTAVLAGLSLLAFLYGFELAQAVWFLAMPYIVFNVMTLRLAQKILDQNAQADVLLKLMYRYKMYSQLLGFAFISLTFIFAFFHLLLTGYFR